MHVMRAVLQRVREARVAVAGAVVGRIDRGLVALIGVADGDTEADADALAGKIADLRLFPAEDSDDGMERSVCEIGGAVLAVSQFTLLGDCRKGRRPSWSAAARPEEAARLYERVVSQLRARQIVVETGVFRAHMDVHLVNEGPVTVLLDSRRTF